MDKDNKIAYDKYCIDSNPPIFFNSWWLDAVCGKNGWSAVIARNKSDEIVGVLPFHLIKRYGFQFILPPKLTLYLGPHIQYGSTDLSFYKKDVTERKVYQELIDQLPKKATFIQKFHPDFKNGLPFRWNGFEETTFYHHIIKDTSNPGQLLQNFQKSTRNKIKKTLADFTIEETDQIEVFYNTWKQSFERQKIKAPYSIDFFIELFTAIQKHGAGTIYLAKDKQGLVHTASLSIWDKHFFYSLATGSAIEYRNSGAYQALKWHQIQVASSMNLPFHFGGSSMEAFANLNANFNAEKVVGRAVRRYGRRWMKLIL